jgi:hypothetical protein
MALMLEDVLNFLAAVNWIHVIISVFALTIGVVVGIWIPARLFELYTGQPAVRYIWYFVGGMMLVMVYLSLYGYGSFWTLFAESGGAEEYMPIDKS